MARYRIYDTAQEVEEAVLKRIVVRDDGEPLTLADYEILDEVRPRTLADCMEGGRNAARPCPWVGCRAHLATSQMIEAGKTVDPTALDDEPFDPDILRMAETCVFDWIAKRGGSGMAEYGEIADALNVTEARAHQIADEGLRKIRRSAQLRVFADE